jgi:hypothetical protein
MVRRSLGLITEEELAAALGITAGTLKTWRAVGTGPDYVKLGKSVFYTAMGVAGWVRDQSVRNLQEQQSQPTNVARHASPRIRDLDWDEPAREEQMDLESILAERPAPATAT